MKQRATKSLTAWLSVLALIAALLAMVAVGCGSGTDDGATGGATINLTEADNGKAFTVKVGDTISVVLAGNPTTGYAWASALADKDKALLTTSGDPTYTADSVAPEVVGSGGKYTFVFTAAAAGKAELALKYWRSFEAQTEPLQTFTASITIQ